MDGIKLYDWGAGAYVHRVYPSGAGSHSKWNASQKTKRNEDENSENLYENTDTFAMEYDNTLGKKHRMRLEATTHEGAIREAKTF